MEYDWNYIKIKSKIYKRKNELGNGGYGHVFLVEDENDNKKYAIKQILFKGRAESDINSIENEIKILLDINNEGNNDKNHIIKYYDSDKDNEYFNIRMEYCEGQSLRELINDKIDKNELIEEKTIYKYILDICLGIKTIHEKKIVHRDLKPDNIFLTKDDKIKIGDFGISKKLDTLKQYLNTNAGTIYYMAPEIISNQNYNYKVDIWALGCIIYELLTLKVCFEDKNEEILKEKIKNKDHDKIRPHTYNSKWQELIDLLLQKDYLKRPSIDEIIDILKSDFRISDLQDNKMKRIYKKDFESKILEDRNIYSMRSK